MARFSKLPGRALIRQQQPPIQATNANGFRRFLDSIPGHLMKARRSTAVTLLGKMIPIATESCTPPVPMDAKVWLADLLARIADMPQSRLHELLPWTWKAARAENQAA